MRLLRQREHDECLSGTDSLGALRRRCEDYALKAMAYLTILREIARPGRSPNPMSGSFEVVAGEPLFLSTLIHIAEGKRDRGH